MFAESVDKIHGGFLGGETMLMKIVEDRKCEGRLWPFHCSREQLDLSQLESIRSFRYQLASAVFDLNLMDSVSVDDDGGTSWLWQMVSALVATVAKTQSCSKGEK
jgi:hypothetical protein